MLLCEGWGFVSVEQERFPGPPFERACVQLVNVSTPVDPPANHPRCVRAARAILAVDGALTPPKHFNHRYTNCNTLRDLISQPPETNVTQTLVTCENGKSSRRNEFDWRRRLPQLAARQGAGAPGIRE